MSDSRFERDFDGKLDREAFQSAWNEFGTLVDLIRYAASEFSRHGLEFGHGTDNALDEAHTLVLGGLELDRSLGGGPGSRAGGGLPPELYSARVTRAESSELMALVMARIERRCPAAYLLGRAWFGGLELYVDERVLVPRSPLAELIEAGFEPWVDAGRVRRVLEIGTGSGCIAVACALALPDAEIVATDIDAGAREVAAINVRRYGLEERVRVLEADVYEGVSGRFDLIVSNPPYVAHRSLAALPREFTSEPRIGLDGGVDGLAVVGRIVSGAAAHLAPEGVVVVEVGESRRQAERRYAGLDIEWLDDALERGGEGIFVLRGEALGEDRRPPLQ